MKSTLLLILSAFALALTLTSSHALLRSAAAFAPMGGPWIIRTGAALFLYALVFFVYSALLRHFDISTLYPLYTALSIIGVSVLGMALFGESVTSSKIVGLALMTAGIALISM